MIPIEELITGEVYFCDARNFTLGRWLGKDFIYVRNKFGTKYFDTEIHWDEGPPNGTAKPLRPANEEELLTFITEEAEVWKVENNK